METQTLKITFKNSFELTKHFWIKSFIKAASPIATFFLTLILLSVLGILLSDWKIFFFTVLAISLLVPLLSFWLTHKIIMGTYKNAFAKLSEEEKSVEISLTENSDGFEVRNGKNYSFVSWDSVESVSEENNQFIINFYGRQMFVPKSAFHNEEENIFRNLFSKFVKFSDFQNR